MNKLFAILVTPFFLLSLAANGQERPRLTFKGLGEVRIGMTSTQVKALGFRLTTGGPWGEVGDNDFIACHYLDSAPNFPGIALMMNDDRLVRIDIGFQNDKGWQSLSGAKIGMTKAELIEIYGDWLRIAPHPYGGEGVDNWAYLTLRSSNGRYSAVFEMTDRKISAFRMGKSGAVGYIEGCA